MNRYVDDAYQLIQYLQIKKVTIIGTSYGSTTALKFAIDHPQMVDQLILVGGAPSYKFLAKAKKNLRQRGTEDQKKICEKLWAGTFRNDKEMEKFFTIMAPLYS
jgi:proline iminopeptidase